MRPNTITDIEQFDERVQDLLVERTLWGLDPSQETELSGSVRDVEGSAYEFERAVGALSVGMHAFEDDRLPDSLRARLSGLATTDAVRSIWEPDSSPLRLSGLDSDGSGGGTGGVGAERRGVGAGDDTGVAGGAGPLQWLGWLAAAACLTYAVFVTMPEPGPAPGGVVPALMARVGGATDLIRANWAGTSAIGAENHALDGGVRGEVVWSDDLDEGFMTISGIEPNDPNEFQYQLWIFDAERRTGDLPQFRAEGLPELLTQRPVDGGVFDVSVSSDGEIVVPVDAKLPVGKAAIFAVTKEPPGGVVVSDREIVFLALRG